MITILYKPEVRSILHTLYPLILSRHYREFFFTKDLEIALKKPKSKIIVLSRYFKEKYGHIKENRAVIEKLRQVYEKVIYVDDSDGADSIHFGLIDLFDLYYKSQLLKDRSLFLRDMYRHQLFSDYYHRKFNIKDEEPVYRIKLTDPQQLEKLRVFWNLGVGSFPMSYRYRNMLERLSLYINFPQYKWLFAPRKMRRIENPPSEKKLKKIQSRFIVTGRRANSIDHQRYLLLEKIAANGESQEIFTTGYISRTAYYKELAQIAAVLSPFGWGEICFRDFEAIIYGSVLIKPDMSHLETWPDIYQKNHTYVSVDWDGTSLIQTCENVINHLANFDKMTTTAHNEYFSQLSLIDNRIEGFLNEWYHL